MGQDDMSRECDQLGLFAFQLAGNDVGNRIETETGTGMGTGTVGWI